MLVIVLGIAFFQYYTSDKLALAAAGREGRDARGGSRAARHGRASVRDGRPAEAEDRDDGHPRPERLRHRTLAEACRGLRDPGLWDRLEPKEIEGVLAHELSHIANRDVLIMTVASFFAMLAAMLTRFGLYAGMWGGGGNRDNNNGPPIWLIVVAVAAMTYPISFVLIRTISRYREYAADRGSALITGAPEYLMSALQKISSQMTLIPNQDLRQVQGMSAFFIIPAQARGIAELFMDHPPLEKRIAALAEIAREMGRPVA